MADKKISALTSASTPLAGTEVLPIVQSGATVKATVKDLQIAGSILQVVNSTFATSTSTSSTSYIDTGLTASITPRSATSKILAIVSMSGLYQSGANFVFLQLLRSSTVIGGEFAGATGYSALGGAGAGGSASMSYLDSPATTSAVTYKVQGKTSGGLGYWSNNNSTCSLTLMEVSA